MHVFALCNISRRVVLYIYVLELWISNCKTMQLTLVLVYMHRSLFYIFFLSETAFNECEIDKM
jgi:hypothetical protein